MVCAATHADTGPGRAGGQLVASAKAAPCAPSAVASDQAQARQTGRCTQMHALEGRIAVCLRRSAVRPRSRRLAGPGSIPGTAKRPNSGGRRVQVSQKCRAGTLKTAWVALACCAFRLHQSVCLRCRTIFTFSVPKLGERPTNRDRCTNRGRNCETLHYASQFRAAS